jgi:hypothetical protein
LCNGLKKNAGSKWKVNKKQAVSKLVAEATNCSVYLRKSAKLE